MHLPFLFSLQNFIWLKTDAQASTNNLHFKRDGEEKKHPSLYLTHCVAPLAHQRCANEYFNESKWILLLSQRCWHRLRSYRWSISARHAPVARVMYQDFMGSGHFRLFVSLYISLRRGLLSTMTSL